MSTTLGELFADQGTDTVSHQGRIVKALVRIPVKNGDTVVVTRQAVGSSRNQAVKLALAEGALHVGDHAAPAMALWSHTSPETVELTVDTSGATTLDVWNAWSMGGVDSSWVGNAGITTRNTSNGTVLRCSDGIGPADFGDLEVTIAVRSA